MIVGFSGTKRGMTSDQELEVRLLLNELMPTEVHHGWCVGSDDEFHNLVKREHPQAVIHLHPGVDKNAAAPTRGLVKPRRIDIVHTEKFYLTRDEDIARVCQVLIATPKEDHMIVRSGTWTTVRRAIKYGKDVRIVLPDGEVWDGEAW